MAEKEKARYAPPASQVDLEERLKSGNKSTRVLSTSDAYETPVSEEGDGRDFRVEDNDTSEYVGVSPEYANYANETEAPLPSEKGAEAEVFKHFAEAQRPAVARSEADGGERDEDEVEEEEEAQKAAAEKPQPQTAATKSTAKKPGSSSS